MKMCKQNNIYYMAKNFGNLINIWEESVIIRAKRLKIRMLNLANTWKVEILLTGVQANPSMRLNNKIRLACF